jgi:hypothetical protein
LNHTGGSFILFANFGQSRQKQKAVGVLSQNTNGFL